MKLVNPTKIASRAAGEPFIDQVLVSETETQIGATSTAVWLGRESGVSCGTCDFLVVSFRIVTN